MVDAARIDFELYVVRHYSTGVYEDVVLNDCGALFQGRGKRHAQAVSSQLSALEVDVANCVRDTQRHSPTRASTTQAVWSSISPPESTWLMWICVVLLESPFDPLRRQMNSVLLTVDLTKAVADEAIQRNDSIIVTYRMCICDWLDLWCLTTGEA